MEVYLDNSATTMCFEEVAAITTKVMCEEYANPSSVHSKGFSAEKYLKSATSSLATILKVKEKEIIYTSGGTESNNLAIIGAARANARAGKHLITTKIEHPSVIETMKYLEGEGFIVTYLPVNENNMVDIKDLKNALRSDTILVSVMHVNNEIGLMADIESIANEIKAYNSKIIFHVDAVQSFGKLVIYPSKMKIDMLSISAHKIHGPKGVGLLYVNEKVKIQPITYGGGQQKGMRSGTENVHGIAGMAIAAMIVYEDYEKQLLKLIYYRDKLIEALSKMENVILNSGDGTNHAPHIVNASFIGIKSEVLLHALADKGIYVSSGSACASNHPKPSETLVAIGKSKEEIDSAIRFSFSIFNQPDEIEYVVERLNELVPVLRKYRAH